jgi:hypothetical protein
MMLTASKHRELFPADSGRESVEVKIRDMPCTVTSLTFTTPHKVNQRLVFDLIPSEQLGVIPEIPQKPTQLPQGSGRAVQATADATPDQMFGLENNEADLVIRLLLLPAISRVIYTNQEKTIWNGVQRGHIPRAKRLEIAIHAAPSFWLG